MTAPGENTGEPTDGPRAAEHPFGEPAPAWTPPPSAWPAGPPAARHQAQPQPSFRHQYPATLPQPPAAPSRPAGVPGWVWPVLVAAGLVLGLLGGLLGGALVLGTTGSTGGSQGALADSGARPLEADNGSIAAVAAKVLPSTVQVQVQPREGDVGSGATGSGFVVDDEGHVITNAHVVADASDRQLRVIDVDGRTHRATVVGRSPVYDIAVLALRGDAGLEPAAMGSSRAMQVGESVVAIGSPLGLSATVTSGIVSALDRPVTTGSDDVSAYINAVQTDAAINPGNSGGPLVNMRGQVVGVNSAIATTGGLFGGDSGNIGVGFAIPMEQVRVTARQLLDTGRAEYPVIGANVATGRSTDGATLAEVPAGTPAARAGLEVGDRVVAVEGERVTDGVSLIVSIRSHRPGDTIEMTVVRDGEERTVRVRLDAKVG